MARNRRKIKRHRSQRQLTVPRSLWLRNIGLATVGIGISVMGAYLLGGSSNEASIRPSVVLDYNRLYTKADLRQDIICIRDYVDAKNKRDNVDNIRSLLDRDYDFAADFRKVHDDPSLFAIYGSIKYYKDNPSASALDELIPYLDHNIGTIEQSDVLIDHLKLIHLAKKINENYDLYREAMLDHLDLNWKSIYDVITKSEGEVGGFVDIGPSGLSFEFCESEDFLAANSYIKSVLSEERTDLSDYPEKMEFLSSIDGVSIKNMLQAYICAKAVTQIDKDDFAWGMNAGPFSDAQKNAYISSLPSALHDAMIYDKYLRMFMNEQFDTRAYINEIIDSDSVVSHFHSHPDISDKKVPLGPSRFDLRNSTIYGNGMVFEILDNHLNVYEYRFNESRLVRSYSLE